MSTVENLRRIFKKGSRKLKLPICIYRAWYFNIRITINGTKVFKFQHAYSYFNMRVTQERKHSGDSALYDFDKDHAKRKGKRRRDGNKCIKALYPLSLWCSSYLGFSKCLW